MKVLILGSGVIGVSTAYYLAKSGHEVIVVDRRDGPGLETSYGNAGEVSPGYSSPWAAPKLVWKAVKWLVMKNRPLVIWPRPDPAMVEWGLQLGKQGGTVKLLGESRGLGELDGEQGCCGLCGLLDAADVVPRLEGVGPLGAVVGGGHAVAGQEEEVVDLIVGGEEALSVSG